MSALTGTSQKATSVTHMIHPAKFANVVVLTRKIPPLLSMDQIASGTASESTENPSDKEIEPKKRTAVLDDTEDIEDEELKELQTDYERRKEERKKEQDLAVLERQRLEEILRICNEYDEQQIESKEEELTQKLNDEKRDSRSSSWGSNTKIKTNGSLTSPASYRRCSDEMNSHFSEGNITIPKMTTPETRSDVPIQSRPVQTSSDQVQYWPAKSGFDQQTRGNSYARILKLHSGPNDAKTEENGRSSNSDVLDVYDVFQLSSTGFSDTIDDDNLSTDCFQDETTSLVSNDLSELSFQTTSSVTNGSWNKKDGNGAVHPNATAAAAAAAADLKESQKSPMRLYDSGDNTSERRYQKSMEDVKERIQVLKRRISDVKNMEEKTICETQAELELLQWEHNTLIDQLQREKDRIAAINHQQMELLFEAAKEREEAQKQIECERRKVEELEERLEETKKRCRTLGIDPEDNAELKKSAFGELVIKEIEELEQRTRLFDDLEFHLLEMETRREEEREPQQRKLMAELNQLKHSSGLVQETLLQLMEQKSSLIRQVKSDVIDLEKERLLLVEDFRKEKQKLTCLMNEGSVNIGSKQINQKYLCAYSQGGKRNVVEYMNANLEMEDELLPNTPSSTTSVIQRLQELTSRDPMAQKASALNEDARNDGFRDGDEDDAAVDSHSLGSSSNFSIDRLKFWLDGDQKKFYPYSKAKFYSGSDGDSSVFSNDDQNLSPKENFDMESNKFKDEEDQHQELEDDHSDDRHYIKHSRQSAEEVRKWQQGEALSADDQSLSPQSPAAATGVVLRTGRKTQSRPMTRYLPVRGSCDLDLRQFIESSGHRLEGNIHVQITSSACRGFLVKLGRRFRLWHRRWFVFDRSRRSVIYYTDQTEKKTRGCIKFSAIEDVFVDHMRTVRSPSPKLTFCLKTTVKNFFLVAPSPEAMRIWIDVLFTGAEGYQEFT